jgi:hypothetical protein
MCDFFLGVCELPVMDDNNNHALPALVSLEQMFVSLRSFRGSVRLSVVIYAVLAAVRRSLLGCCAAASAETVAP